jgi:hypothetical protein
LSPELRQTVKLVHCTVANPAGKHSAASLRRGSARIHKEAIVDAGPGEQALNWYYYLENKICFPFQAKCLAAKFVSALRKGETVEAVRMAPDDACAHDMLVLVRWQGRKMAVPLVQLTPVDPDESTAAAIGDRHHWVAQGYCL